jgi:F0F1-type ATP synthase assembly protein I
MTPTLRRSDSEPAVRVPLSPEILRRFVFIHTGVSSVAAVAFLLFRDVSWVRGAAGGVGIMSALIANGVAIWFAIRARNFKLVVAAVASALPLAFWTWVIFGIVRVNEA